MLRVEAEHFGVSRDTLVEALCAERIPCSAGYAYSLPQQPIFENKAFGPYIPKATARLKFNKVRCPNSDLICKEQCVWLGQNIFLGQRKDMDDIADAFKKIYEQRQTLNAKFPSNP